jgi:hypothetical protein
MSMSSSPAIVQLNFPAMQSLAAPVAPPPTQRQPFPNGMGMGGAPMPGGTDTFEKGAMGQQQTNPNAFFLPPIQHNAFK